MRRNTLPVILDYCGGTRTDALYEMLSEYNKEYSIRILDNASPRNSSRHVTHRNAYNTFIGGGIRDSLMLAEKEGATFLFFVSNDLEFIRMPSIEYFESLALADDSIVLVGASITEDSRQAAQYPWMVNKGLIANRIVPHYDPLCCLIRLEFIRDFGGFPRSRGGWGYDWEMATYARYRSKKILTSDSALIQHAGDSGASGEALGPHFDKFREMKRIYNRRYGDYRLLLSWRLSGIMLELQYQFSEGAGVGDRTRQLGTDELARVLLQLKKESLFDAPHHLGAHWRAKSIVNVPGQRSSKRG